MKIFQMAGNIIVQHTSTSSITTLGPAGPSGLAPLDPSGGAPLEESMCDVTIFLLSITILGWRFY